MREVKPRWIQKKFGLQLGYTDLTQLTNLRFADDVLLMSPTLPRLQHMLHDAATVAKSRGLELHPDKTKKISNVTQKRVRSSASHANVMGMSIEILPYSASLKYLGRMITFDACHSNEVENRIACAWRRFMVIRNDLTNKRYSLDQRMRLFDMTVFSTMLYGTAAWTLTNDLENQVRRTQRKMLRMVLHYPRHIISEAHEEKKLEPWVEWVKRTTHAAETRLDRLNLRDWVESHHDAKTKWHAKISTGSSDNWAYWAFHWSPCGTRKQGDALRKNGLTECEVLRRHRAVSF